MNKKLLVVAIAGWVTSAIFLNELVRLNDLIKSHSQLIEDAATIVTDYEFQRIVEQNDL